MLKHIDIIVIQIIHFLSLTNHLLFFNQYLWLSYGIISHIRIFVFDFAEYI